MILYTTLVHRAIADMARTLPDMGHVDASRLCVVAAPRAGAARYGNLAQCAALGEDEQNCLRYWYDPRSREVTRVTPWGRRVNTRVVLRGERMLYVVLLRLPRLLEHDAIETVVHELLHIGPRFDGRIRRMRHGRRFDSAVRYLTDCWRRRGDPELVEALGASLTEATARWGPLVAASFGPPFEPCRMVPMDNPPALASHPDFQRLGLDFDAGRVAVARVGWTGDRVPEELTERDLVYRMYGDGSRTARISASVLRSARGLFPPGAMS